MQRRWCAGTVTGPDAGVGPAVIDASVGLKWVLPEPGADAAIALRDRLVAAGSPVYVPDLFWAEAANVLWRLTRGRRASLDRAEAGALLDVLRAAPLTTEPVSPLAGRALEVACVAGITVYDAAYIALAELRGALLWTADRRLVDALAETAWAALARPPGPPG